MEVEFFFCGGAVAGPCDPVIVCSSGWLELPCLWEHRGKLSDTCRTLEMLAPYAVHALHVVGLGQEGVLRLCFWVCDFYSCTNQVLVLSLLTGTKSVLREPAMQCVLPHGFVHPLHWPCNRCYASCGASVPSWCAVGACRPSDWPRLIV